MLKAREHSNEIVYLGTHGLREHRGARGAGDKAADGAGDLDPGHDETGY